MALAVGRALMVTGTEKRLPVDGAFPDFVATLALADKPAVMIDQPQAQLAVISLSHKRLTNMLAWTIFGSLEMQPQAFWRNIVAVQLRQFRGNLPHPLGQ